MDKRIGERVGVKWPLCWHLTPNLICSVRVTQCLLLSTWTKPKLLGVKCDFPEDCVSTLLLVSILSSLPWYPNSVIPIDLPCWFTNQASLLRSLCLCTACPHHPECMSLALFLSHSEISSLAKCLTMPCCERLLGLCTQTCCIKLDNRTSVIGVLVLLYKSEPFGNKGYSLNRETKEGTQSCGWWMDKWMWFMENIRIWKHLILKQVQYKSFKTSGIIAKRHLQSTWFCNLK